MANTLINLGNRESQRLRVYRDLERGMRRQCDARDEYKRLLEAIENEIKDIS